MRINCFYWEKLCVFCTALIILFTPNSTTIYAQVAIQKKKTPLVKDSKGNYKLDAIAGADKDLFGTRASYIKNIGQYGETIPGYSNMGTILYGYEGLNMPVLFTAKGVIHLQRSQHIPTYEERSEMILAGLTKEERKKRNPLIERTITFEWINANPNPEIIAEGKSESYHVYGLLKEKAYGYKKIIYKNLYPGINVEYSFINSDKPGYEFNLVVSAGADLSKVKMRYGGDVLSVKSDNAGRLLIKSDIDEISQSVPVCFFSDTEKENKKTKAAYFIKNNEVSFSLPSTYSKSRSFVIDPFVSSTTTSLTGGKAKDIDFDYAGNVFVGGGGGNGGVQMLAKFSAAGALLWTFSGTLANPFWSFGNAYGGWVVDKVNGGVYMGQGLSGSGFVIVRLNANGVYDNYISTANSSFSEDWKMIWSCNGGTPSILIAGGGGNANNELAVLNPATTLPAATNLSGLTGGHNDISDIVIDPISNEMFTIYSTPSGSPATDNLMYKHLPPYNFSTLAWKVPTTWFSLKEPNNRPYMGALDNSSNTLAVNSFYLFYWDGRNLKAIDKATGATIGPVVSFSTNVLLRQGGIYADECNNIFIGFTNGTVKVLRFNGTAFDDAVAPDITITGYPTFGVYDLAHDNANELLYVSGDGFVASVDISSYCPSPVYLISVDDDCSTLTAKATVSPVPPAGTTVTYIIYDSTTQIASNTTGTFTGLSSGINYTIRAFLNRACGGTQTVTNFIFPPSPLLVTHDPPMVCLPNGTADLTVAAITAGSDPGQALSYWTDSRATVPLTNPAAALAGTYYIKGILGTNCPAITEVTVPSFPVPVADAGSGADICFKEIAQLNAAPGAVAYSWSPATYLSNTNIPNPTVINAPSGTHIYHLTITDANGCRSLVDETVTVVVAPVPKIGIPGDTAIAFNQPLQLNIVDVNNSGFVDYVWTPTRGLNDPFIANPIATIDRDIIYMVTARTAQNCEGTAAINVKVYQGPDIYVPTAFTPGGNGLNDILNAISVGMKEFHYFRIYNRWGQMVFNTANARVGWDGKINGILQGSATFVWIAEAVDYTDKLIRRKGTVTLIR
jgi:gliding motility-associated-like protein